MPGMPPLSKHWSIVYSLLHPKIHTESQNWQLGHRCFSRSTHLDEHPSKSQLSFALAAENSPHVRRNCGDQPSLPAPTPEPIPRPRRLWCRELLHSGTAQGTPKAIGHGPFCKKLLQGFFIPLEENGVYWNV